MKLMSFVHAGRASYGIVDGNNVLDIGGVLRDRLPDLKSFLGSAKLRHAEEAKGGAEKIPLRDLQFLPVIPNPEKIVCIGLNYEEHRLETGRAKSEYPTIFTRFKDTQVGHLQPVWAAPESSHVDFEGELAVIIGKRARRVAKGQALDCVAGYSCYNDVSMRDWQRHTSQFIPGKNFPNSGPFGPWLVTKDEIPHPQALALSTRLNGSVVQQTKIGQMIFPIEELIAYITGFTSLDAGDVIVTGTPSGIGYKRQPPLFMKPGDQVEVEIDSIGTLQNPIMAEPR